MSSTVQLEVGADGVGLITINRPEVRNALDPAAMRALADAVARAEATSDLRALVLAGAGGRAFISGGDVRALHGDLSEQSAFQQHDLMATTLNRLGALPVPVIAALEGATRGGGCEVALASDVRVAAEDATFGFVQVNLAVMPGWGGVARLIQAVGHAQATDLLLTGRVLDAQEALRIGLVSRLCPPGEALPTARALAGQIAGQPPLAVAGIKRVLRGYQSLPPDAARALERETFARLWASADHAEASTAYQEKRPPVFRGT